MTPNDVADGIALFLIRASIGFAILCGLAWVGFLALGWIGYTYLKWRDNHPKMARSVRPVLLALTIIVVMLWRLL